ncbi:MAG: sterol desaturase family protein, partial [Polyangiaceae bacterium]|nr:sterol desaturase family protein [Polyangiaceae bacterium]
HKTRLLWTLHVVHHSGRHFNLSLGARQSWLERAIVTPLIYMGALVPFCALFDIAFAYLILGHQLVYLAGFLTHTKSFDYWPSFFRHIFINPIEHRIHHGMEEQHLDCNYGFALKIWDRVFRTYQAPDAPASEISVGVKNQEFTASVLATQAQTFEELAVWAREVEVFPALQSLSSGQHKVDPTSLENVL